MLSVALLGGRVFRFGQVELDEDVYELRRAGVAQAVEPKVLDVLLYLVRNPNRLVTKTELLDRVWPDAVVAESALTRAVSLARAAIGDTAQRQQLIETVSGRGYRFRAPVRVIVPHARGAESVRAEPPDAPAPRVFVGREPELAELGQGLDDVRAGRGRFFLIDGEPGIGKTRLAEEIAAAASDLRAIWGRSWEAGGAPTYWPWTQVLRGLLAGLADGGPPPLGADWAAEIALVVPELRDRSGLAPARASVTSESARFRLFDAIGRLVARATAERPTLLVFDDLHAADQPTLLLLAFVVREVLHQSRCLILATYRSREARRSPEIDALLAQMAREGRQLPLAGWTESEVGEFIARRSGRPTDSAIARAVHQATGGNPLFVDEVVRGFLATGGARTIGAGSEIPSGVRQAVGRRLQGISEPCRRMLGFAAVIGRDFDLATLEGACGVAGGELIGLLEDALATGIVVAAHASPARYSFSHAIAREAICADLSESERAGAHRRVGEAIEALGTAAVEERLSELAHHFLAAGGAAGAAKAIDYCRRAADRAMAILAFEEAAIHYRRALDALVLAPSERARYELSIALGRAENHAGRYDAARALFREAAELARRAGSAADLATAAIGYGGAGIRAGRVDPELVALLEEALRGLEGQRGSLRAQVLARLALQLYWSPDRERCAKIAREAVDAARETDDRAALADALVSLHWALWLPEHVEQRLVLAEEILRLGEELRAPEFIVNARRYLVVALLEIGDMARADAEIEALAQQSESYRAALHLWYAPLLRASRALMEGRFAAAPALIEQALETGRKANNEDMLLFYGVQTFALLRDLGRLTELEAAVVAVTEANPALPAWRSALAYLWAETGREERARAEFERLSAGDFAFLPRDVNWLPGIALLAEICARLGDAGHAARLYELLLPFDGRNILVGTAAALNGPTAYFLGILATAMGRHADAVAHLEAALAATRRMKTRPAEARAALALAEALAARGDRTGAALRAREARDNAHELGMEIVAARAAAALESNPGGS